MWTEKDELEVDECFEMFDEEAEEILDVCIVGKMMGLLGWNPTNQDLDDLVRKQRFKKKGQMDKPEFKCLMKLWYDTHDKDDEESLRNAFKVFDSDGSGFIEWDELQFVLQGCGEPLSNEELQIMMKEADKDGDGKIDYDEFVAMMRGDQQILS